MGRIRLLRVAFPLLLGTASPSNSNTVGAADHLRSRRCQSRRTRHLLCHVGPRRDSPPRPDHHGRQRLSQRRLRGRPRSCRDQPHPTRHQNRTTPGGQNRSSKRYARPSNRSTTPSKDQLGLERHGGRTRTGVWVRILQRILALTTVIWHNQTTNRPGPARSLIAYDH